MGLDFGNQLFGDSNPLVGRQEYFSTAEEAGGMTLIFPQGESRDLTLSALSIFGTLQTEKEKVKGYRFTVKLFNNEGTGVAFTYKIFAAGIQRIPASGTIPITLSNEAQYTKTWFLNIDKANPGDLIQLSIGGDILGTAAAGRQCTFLEFKVETIMERKYGIL